MIQNVYLRFLRIPRHQTVENFEERISKVNIEALNSVKKR